MKKQALILEYEEELNAILQMFEVSDIESIPEKQYQWRAGSILRFIKDLMDLDAEIENGENKRYYEINRFAVCSICLNHPCIC